MRHLPAIQQQLKRTRELDELRCQRPLTDAEQAEADRLTARAQMRAWRAVQAQRERRLAGQTSTSPFSPDALFPPPLGASGGKTGKVAP